MGIEAFFSKIGDGVKSVANTVGSAFSSGYKDIKNVVSGTGNFIESQAKNGYATVNNVIQAGKDTVTNVINKGSGLVQNAEDRFSSIISTPLLLIAAGVAGLLIFNGKTVVQTAGDVATRIPPI